MGRIDRKGWLNKDMGIKSKGGMFDMFDNHIKVVYRINDEEFDYLCEVMSDDETDIFVNERPTFSDKRKMIELLNKHIRYER
jgi:hypothetical protein